MNPTSAISAVECATFDASGETIQLPATFVSAVNVPASGWYTTWFSPEPFDSPARTLP